MSRLFTVLCVVFFSVSLAQARMVSIDGNSVNLRAGPGKHYRVIWELGHGYPLRVLATRGDWVRVRDFENDSGWVYRNLLSDEGYVIVRKHMVNLRSGPGRKYRLVGRAAYGVVFKVMETQGKWVRVRHQNGVSGWVFRSLLWGW